MAIFGQIRLKKLLYEHNLMNRPLHIISANLHSIINSIYAYPILAGSNKNRSIEELAEILSKEKNEKKRIEVLEYALKNGLFEIKDTSGTNITVQIIDTAKLPLPKLSKELKLNNKQVSETKPILLIMDYAFGEQAYETMDELLKSYEKEETINIPLNVESISIMGKAGILGGGKGDILIPTAHVFEGQRIIIQLIMILDLLILAKLKFRLLKVQWFQCLGQACKM